MKLVFVVWRVLGMFDHEVLKGRPVHRRVELAGHGQGRVADGLGLELPPVHPPEVRVAGIGGVGCGPARRGLPVGRRGHDQAVQRLERLTAVAKLHGQPVEQLGMRGQLAHPAEVVGRGHDPPAEVILPDPVDDRPPGQGVARVGEPARQGRAAVALGVAGGARTCRGSRQADDGAGADLRAGVADIATRSTKIGRGLPPRPGAAGRRRAVVDGPRVTLARASPATRRETRLGSSVGCVSPTPAGPPRRRSRSWSRRLQRRQSAGCARGIMPSVRFRPPARGASMVSRAVTLAPRPGSCPSASSTSSSASAKMKSFCRGASLVAVTRSMAAAGRLGPAAVGHDSRVGHVGIGMIHDHRDALWNAGSSAISTLKRIGRPKPSPMLLKSSWQPPEDHPIYSQRPAQIDLNPLDRVLARLDADCDSRTRPAPEPSRSAAAILRSSSTSVGTSRLAHRRVPGGLPLLESLVAGPASSAAL